jgi:type III secretory pathway component EscU
MNNNESNEQYNIFLIKNQEIFAIVKSMNELHKIRIKVLLSAIFVILFNWLINTNFLSIVICCLNMILYLSIETQAIKKIIDQ